MVIQLLRLLGDDQQLFHIVLVGWLSCPPASVYPADVEFVQNYQPAALKRQVEQEPPPPPPPRQPQPPPPPPQGDPGGCPVAPPSLLVFYRLRPPLPAGFR